MTRRSGERPWIAWTGQAGTHAPQVVHRAGLIVAPASDRAMACSGQPDRHLAQVLFGLCARRHAGVSSISPARFSSHLVNSDNGLSSRPFFFHCKPEGWEFVVYAHCFTKRSETIHKRAASWKDRRRRCGDDGTE